MDDDTNGNDFLAGLPRELLLDVLRRLPNRAIAESRCVCRPWRAAIDRTAALLARFHRIFPPRAFPGIFTSNHAAVPGGNHRTTNKSSFFNRAGKPPRTPAAASNEPVFWRPTFKHGWASVLDHCNGLLLLHRASRNLLHRASRNLYCVCNPATARCARLHGLPTRYLRSVFLAFDPAVSRHHEVFWFRIR